MFSRNHLLLLGALSILGLSTLSGCQPSPRPTAIMHTSTAPTATASTTKSAAGSAPTAAPTVKQDLAEMNKLIPAIQADVRADNLETAQSTFSNVQGSWKRAAPQLKADNKDAYDAIEARMENLQSEFSNLSPEGDSILKTLDLLTTEVESVD
ncbi:MAG: hypothetical protein WA949_06695 [Phormidesmis sp.]